MKLRLVVIAVTIFIIANIYFDGRLLSRLKEYKKYYKMSFIAFAGLCVYLMMKNKPQHIYDLCKNANTYVKYMPIDRNTRNMMMPIIDFTKQHIGHVANTDENTINPINYPISTNERKILSSGQGFGTGTKTKRSVSETKKKYVAAEQSWKCKHCQRQLPAWFEVDHVVKLEYGGSNSIDNLEALCRDCHGKKTAMENL